MSNVYAAPQPDEEARWIREAQRNPQAFQPLYERWVTPLYHYLIAQTGSAPDAQDLTAQVFLAAMQALPRYRHNGHFAGWLFTIARNQAREFFRKHAREVGLEQAEGTPSAALPLGEALADAEELLRLRALLRALPAEEQELLRLRYSAGLRFADIGAALGRSEEAVKKAVYRLQARLQCEMEETNER